jgi:hypothetical protein
MLKSPVSFVTTAPIPTVEYLPIVISFLIQRFSLIVRFEGFI